MGFPVFTRRRFLSAVLAGGGLTLFGGGALFALRGRAPHVDGLRVLSDHEYRTLSRLATALFPEGGAFPEGAAGADLARIFDGFLEGEPAWNRRDLGNALLLLELGPVVFEGRLATFSHLDDAERLAHFERWRESESIVRRQAATAFHKFLSTVFYDRPLVWPRIGYDGPVAGG
jgi:hypothetical protein